MRTARLRVVFELAPCLIVSMKNDILRFGLMTPSLVIESEEMPRARIINLIIDHVPDDREAGEAIEMIAIATSGQYDGEGWSIWFAVRGETLH